MPHGDRTGPSGQGPRTGRAFGFCSGYDTPGYINYYGHAMGRGPGRGKGSGRGSRRGMGYRHGNNPGNVRFDVTDAKLHKQHVRKEDEIKWLKSEAESLRRAQTDIENRLNDLQHKSE